MIKFTLTLQACSLASVVVMTASCGNSREDHVALLQNGSLAEIKREFKSIRDTAERLPQSEDDTKSYTTPLHIAVGHGRVDVVKHLCSLGADVSATDSNGWPPMLMVSHSTKSKADVHSMVAELKRWGADIDQRDEQNGFTALLRAVINGKVAVVEELLSMGAGPRIEVGGKNALSFANEIKEEPVRIEIQTIIEDGLAGQR